METINDIIARPNLFLFLVGALALLVGSFLNVVIYRLPQMMKDTWSQECRQYLGLKTTKTDHDSINLWLPFSHCIQCKKRLKPWHNIPILSYLVLRGRCAYCNAVISARYFLVELLSCVASIYIAIHFGATWEMVAGLIFTWILIALIFIDIDHHLLPDSLTLLLLWLGLIFSIFNIFTTPTDAIIGASIGYLVFAAIQGLFYLATKKVGMGQGDFKFLAGLGAFLGWQQLPIIILFASFTGLIFGLIHLGIRHKFKSVPIPFGPYLAISGWICLIQGNEILRLLTRIYM